MSGISKYILEISKLVEFNKIMPMDFPQIKTESINRLKYFIKKF